ncbi:hypothetical protein PMAYCL1PPCAC_14591, partial [Pristionchus mayeri]
SEEAMHRLIDLSKRLNVPFIIDQIAKFLDSLDRGYLPLKMILHFGYDVNAGFVATCDEMCVQEIDWKLIYQEMQGSPAYKAMSNENARRMLEWMEATEYKAMNEDNARRMLEWMETTKYK